MSRITVFAARKIRTMEPSLPEATAVAVRDGMIVEVGTLETLRPWLEAHPHTIDRQFEKHVLMPGFIDPHLHPSMAAYLLQCEFITAMEWQLPDRTVAPVRTREAFLARVKALHEAEPDPRQPLFTWGYHRDWHGDIWRADLNAISATRPIILVHRSFHETIMNDGALTYFEIDEQKFADAHQVDLPRGHFYEAGNRHVRATLSAFLLSKQRRGPAMKRTAEVIHLGGHTTIGDMAFGIFNPDVEWESSVAAFDNDDTPFRVEFVPHVAFAGTGLRFDQLASLPERNTRRLRFGKHVKLFSDGAFFSQLMQLGGPGYIDGHEGAWLMPPEAFEDAARRLWNEGYVIHVHCTGDLGVELALDVLEKLLWERPRINHRFTIEHFGVSTAAQARRIADLGAIVSANPYYVYELGDIYSRSGLGHERAAQMVRLGSLSRHRVPFALHSDFTMAPARPLQNAWIALNRINAAGDVLCPAERVSLDEALQAITLNAAYVLGLNHEIGSICCGKKADFTVLEADPYEVPPADLKDIPIWGTVFEGQPYPLGRK
jgi:predicted amidohydrolase YtcJ